LGCVSDWQPTTKKNKTKKIPKNRIYLFL